MNKLEVEVLEENTERFKKFVSKLKKMHEVQKIPFTIKDKGESYVTRLKIIRKEEYPVKLKVRNYEIIYDDVKMTDRYKVVGIVEENNHKIIIKYLDKMYTKKIPEIFFSEKLICDHCKTKRKRKSAFIVYDNQTRSLMRLGKSCLQSYIPYNIEKILTLFRYLEEFKEIDYVISTGKVEMYLNFSDVVGIILNELDTNGYHSRSRSLEKESTIYKVLERYYSQDIPKVDVTENLKNLDSITIDEGLKYNIRVFQSENIMKESYLERVIYTLFLLTKNSIKNTATENKKRESKYLGKEGEKKEFIVTGVRSIIIDNPYTYGSSYINIFIDAEGNELMYMGAKKIVEIFKLEEKLEDLWDKEEKEEILTAEEDFLKDYTFKIRATIKGHKEYGGLKQTIIKNIKVLEKC